MSISWTHVYDKTHSIIIIWIILVAFNFVLRWIRWAVSWAFAICIFNDTVRREIRASAQLTVEYNVFASWYCLLLIEIGRTTQIYPLWERLTQMTKAFVFVWSTNQKKIRKFIQMVCRIKGITAEISFDSSTVLSPIFAMHSRIRSFSLPLKNSETVWKRNIQAIRTYALRAKVNLPTIWTYDTTLSTHTHIKRVRQADQSHLWHFGTHVKYWFSLVVHIPI